MNAFINTLKIIGVYVIMWLCQPLVAMFLHWLIYHRVMPYDPVMFVAIANTVSFIWFTVLWVIFFVDSQAEGNFFQSIRLKKTYLVLTLINIFLLFVSGILNKEVEKLDVMYGRSQPSTSAFEQGVTPPEDQLPSQALPAAAFSPKESSSFVGDNVYENHKYGFRLTYPKGSVFGNEQPDYGSVVRFFLPGGKSIKGDEENVAVLISTGGKDAKTSANNYKYNFSQFGPVDFKEVIFGGQKGYRLIVTSSYTAPKGTKELLYVTVKDGIGYTLNYFPVVDSSLPAVDKIAASFEFIK